MRSSTLSLFIMASLLGSTQGFRMKQKRSAADGASLIQAEADTSRFCNPFGSRSLKNYFFEYKFPDREYQTSMLLSRDSLDPELKVFDDKTWVLHQRDKTTAFVDCSKDIDSHYITIEKNGITGQPTPCTKELDGLEGYIVTVCTGQNNSWSFLCGNTFETQCSGWSWFGQCPEMMQLNLTDGRQVYLPKENVRRTANSKPEGDGWIAQERVWTRGTLNQGPSKQPLYWRVECAKAKIGEECSSKEQVIKLRSLASITRIYIDVNDPESGLTQREVGIRLKHADGSEDNFLGGLYYPYETMRQYTWESQFYGANKSVDCWNCTNEAGQGRDTISALSLVWENQASSGTIFRGSLALLTGFLFSAPITGGLLAWNAGSRGYDWWKARKHVKELELSASEKIWSKMECHAMFKRCSADVLVPKEKSCS